MQNDQRQVARAAALVMAAFAVSRVLGLVRQMVFSHYFGAGPEMDVYVAAARIPEAIFLVVAGGALGSAFIPLCTARLTRGESVAAWQLVSALINLLLALLIPVTLACILTAPWLVRTLVAPAMPPLQQAQTVTLMQVMLLSTVIFGVSGVVMGALNAHQHFLLPALAPIFYNLAIIGGALWGGMTDGSTFGAAVGTVIGAALHLLVQVPALVRHGARYVPTFGLHDSDVRQVGLLMLPRVLGMAAVQVNFVVSNNLASGLGIGAISAMDYAWRIMLLPQGIFAQAVGTAAFPTFAAQAAQGELAALRETLATTLRMVTALMLPAAGGLMALGAPLVGLMFERGAFGPQDTQEVAWALALFAVGLPGHAAIEVLARAFYSLHDTWTPALAAGGAVALNIALGLSLPPVFGALGLPRHGGLALANSLAALGETLALLWLIRPRLGGLDVRGVFGLSGRAALAAVGMGLGVAVWMRYAPASSWIQAGIGIPLGVGLYLALALALRIHEVGDVLRLLARRRA